MRKIPQWITTSVTAFVTTSVTFLGLYMGFVEIKYDHERSRRMESLQLLKLYFQDIYGEIECFNAFINAQETVREKILSMEKILIKDIRSNNIFYPEMNNCFAKYTEYPSNIETSADRVYLSKVAVLKINSDISSVFLFLEMVAFSDAVSISDVEPLISALSGQIDLKLVENRLIAMKTKSSRVLYPYLLNFLEEVNKEQTPKREKM
ncbi:MAG TPA: hypothetical protein DCS88_14450 [Alphaproteobacteria bacterium]|nr:hypothetical protein [Alphaproteobacteria bacterium]